MEDLADDFSVGNHHARTVGVLQRGREERDRGHLAFDTEQFDVFADTKRLREDNQQSSDQIRQHPLERQSDAHTRTPPTPTPATKGAVWTPNLSSANTAASANTSSRKTRTASIRMGGSICFLVSQSSATFPIQRATKPPMAKMITAPTILKP